MAPSMAGTPHPGADDNASGTAGVLELARYFAAQPKNRRGILFLCFAGEELGLLGSSFYVNNPVLQLDKAVAMLNLDMIGRIREGKVYVGGAGTGSTLKTILDEVIPRHELKIDYTDQTGYGSSDHTSFTTKQVPVLFFFSGLHADYHRPSDTWDKIEAGEAAKLLRFVADVTLKLAGSDGRPQFVRLAPPRPPGGMGGGGAGYGAYFGSVPDFSEVPEGFRRPKRGSRPETSCSNSTANRSRICTTSPMPCAPASPARRSRSKSAAATVSWKRKCCSKNGTKASANLLVSNGRLGKVEACNLD